MERYLLIGSRSYHILSVWWARCMLYISRKCFEMLTCCAYVSLRDVVWIYLAGEPNMSETTQWTSTHMHSSGNCIYFLWIYSWSFSKFDVECGRVLTLFFTRNKIVLYTRMSFTITKCLALLTSPQTLLNDWIINIFQIQHCL